MACAREMMRWHESEAKLIKRYITKAVNQLKDDYLDSSSDCGYETLITKKKLRKDEEMNKE